MITEQYFDSTQFDVIIIGGSYAGLSAAMALGRSLRRVLVVDGGKPCNRQTPHSHNFLLHDGDTPTQLAKAAKEQALAYPTVQFLSDVVTNFERTENGFSVSTEAGNYHCRKLLLATGIKDLFPAINGFAECWGISILHCPYCHGYEVRGEALGLFANGDTAFELCRLIHHWSKRLTLFTNGPSTLTTQQQEKISQYNIQVIEEPVSSFQHSGGRLEAVVLQTGEQHPLTAVFARIPFAQQPVITAFAHNLLNEHGFVHVNEFQQTAVPGLYACGDCTTGFRSVAMAVASGNKAGAVMNKELIDEDF